MDDFMELVGRCAVNPIIDPVERIRAEILRDPDLAARAFIAAMPAVLGLS